MTSTPTDAERVTRLADELSELGRRLAWARHELLTLPLAGGSPAAPRAAPIQPHPAGAWPAPPLGPARPPLGPPPPAAPTSARPGGDRLLGGRVLAWVGGSMTLIGVVLFLVLAASRGWFGVPARLIAGAALGVALVQVGRWVRRKQPGPGGEVGATALAGTGVAALYLDVGAATAKYQYLPEPVGMLAGLLVAGIGLVLADRWRSAQLAGGVLLGAGFLMPAVTGGSMPLLVALVVVAQAAAVPVVARRGWRATAVIGAAFPLVYGTAAAWHTRFAELFGASGGRLTVTFALVAGFLVGTVGAVVTVRRLPVGLAAGVLVAAPVPALQLAGAHGGVLGGWLAASIGVALLGVALLGVVPAAVPLGGRFAPLPGPVRAAAAAAGAVAVFQATVLWLDGAALTGVLLGQALTLTVVCWSTGRRVPLVGALGYGAAGLWLALTRDAPLRALTVFPADPYLDAGRPDHAALITGLSLSLLTLLLVAGFLLAADRSGWLRPTAAAAARAWLPAGLVTLYGAAGVVVTTGLLIAPVPVGFVTAHAVVTVSWTLAALVLLARGVARPTPRWAGLLLVGAAVAKLLLFDLVALDGLARVGAFVGAGLVLLAAGARYSRLVAAQQPDEVDGPPGQRADHRQPGQPDQPGDHRDGVLDQRPGPGEPG